MLEEKYLDSNIKKLLEENESKENIHIFKVIEKIIPNWIIKKTNFYVKQYKTLENNWFKICSQWKTKPKEILIVEYLPDLDNFENYTILRHIIESLTINGYVIRNIRDITTCDKCNGAMLNEVSFNFLKEQETSIISNDSKWNSICDTCNTSEKPLK